MEDDKYKGYLERKSTHELLAILKYSHRTSGVHYPDYENFPGEYFTQDEIKKVLSTRPHIPNKEERRNIINKMKGIKNKNEY